MRTTIIVNGSPRSGKDSLIDFMRDHLHTARIQTGAFSSIDPVRTMLKRAGFDLESKTAADRLLLATVGDAIEAHSERRTNWSVWNAIDFFNENESGVFFLHVREPEIIGKVRKRLETLKITVLTVLVSSDRAETGANKTDLGVWGMDYDVTIQNNGTLDDLSMDALNLLSTRGMIPVQHSVD